MKLLTPIKICFLIALLLHLLLINNLSQGMLGLKQNLNKKKITFEMFNKDHISLPEIEAQKSKTSNSSKSVPVVKHKKNQKNEIDSNQHSQNNSKKNATNSNKPKTDKIKTDKPKTNKREKDNIEKDKTEKNKTRTSKTNPIEKASKTNNNKKDIDNDKNHKIKTNDNKNNDENNNKKLTAKFFKLKQEFNNINFFKKQISVQKNIYQIGKVKNKPKLEHPNQNKNKSHLKTKKMVTPQKIDLEK
mgnify:CR=1 FL=1